MVRMLFSLGHAASPYLLCFLVGLMLRELYERFYELGYTSRERLHLMSRLAFRHERQFKHTGKCPAGRS